MAAPLTPPDSDLQSFPFMPLQVARLRDSDLAAEANPEACWYAVLLWAAAWHQMPAGSLPDNEAVLTRFCNLGRDLRTFRKHRAEAMRGFILCDDGRWYHPVVAEQVIAAWESKLQQRYRTECARIKKVNQRHGTAFEMPTFDAFMSPDYVAPDAGVSLGTPPPGPPSVPRDKADCPEGQGIQQIQIQTQEREESFALVVSAEPKPTVPVPSARRRHEYPEAFEAAWKAYPHVEGRSSKPNALAEWKRLPTEDRDALPAALARFRPKVADAHGDRGAPCMARWLKDGKHLNWMAGSETAEVSHEVWTQAVAMWRNGEGWSDRLGPAPDQPGTRVPVELRTLTNHELRDAA